MPNPARSMGVNPTLGLTTEPVKVLMGDCCRVVREGESLHAGWLIQILTPPTLISSRSRLASYPSMMLSSWIPCSAILRDGDGPNRRDGLYFAELFRRSRYLAQLCQASVHEGVREDVYSGRHRDCLYLTGDTERCDSLA